MTFLPVYLQYSYKKLLYPKSEVFFQELRSKNLDVCFSQWYPYYGKLIYENGFVHS